MKPRPVHTEPEQYDVVTTHFGDRVRVVPVAPGNRLDKWVFEVRDGEELALRKHIGGEKYNANHTVPDGVPFVVVRALRDAGYSIVPPTDFYTWVSKSDVPSHKRPAGANIPVDSAGDPEWDDVDNYTAEWAQPALADD